MYYVYKFACRILSPSAGSLYVKRWHKVLAWFASIMAEYIVEWPDYFTFVVKLKRNAIELGPTDIKTASGSKIFWFFQPIRINNNGSLIVSAWIFTFGNYQVNCSSSMCETFIFEILKPISNASLLMNLYVFVQFRKLFGWEVEHLLQYHCQWAHCSLHNPCLHLPCSLPWG